MEALNVGIADGQLDSDYRPQPALLSGDEEPLEAVTEDEEDGVWDEAMTSKDVMGLLPGGFLFSVEVDFSDVPVEFNPSRLPFRPKSLERPVETSSPLVDLQTGETVFSPTAVEVRLADGYLPQVAGVDTQC